MSMSKDYINYIMPFYSPADFVVKKAKGSYVWDTNNKKYIDLTASVPQQVLVILIKSS